ncbi:MAG: TatD family hydrolase [Candidatus Omnitrophica bacterium]|nr:TatD family hydrolase [Candidatus Omnitrophota bacterium]
MSTIIDTHTHLYDIPDLAEALCLSSGSGVSDIVALGVDYKSNVRHIELASQSLGHIPNSNGAFGTCPRLYLAFGIHPGNIISDEIEKCFLFFREVLSQLSPSPLWGGSGRGERCPIVAIGECGLDFSYKSVAGNEAKKTEQCAVFQRQLDLAKEFDLPVVIHSRGAERICLDMTLKAGIKKANFHWYSGPDEVLKDILDAGFMMSVSPALEYSVDVRRVAAWVPLDRILVETDTPVRGWIPKDVWRTLDALCSLKKLDKDLALDIVNANARGFFNI